MRVDFALICDAVSVRDNLLHMLGGGITRIWASEFPAPMRASLATRIMLHPTEAEKRHKLRVVIQDEDGAKIGSFDAEFGVGVPDALTPGEEVQVPLGFPLNPVRLPKEGGYSLELLLDDAHQTSVPFRAAARPTPAAADGES